MTEGYRTVGFDVQAHDYGTGGYPGELVLRDVRSISGRELVAKYGVPACIVASPPCQEFSYMAMPWTKAKEKRRRILASETEKARLTDLFNQCFRVQREVSEATGHHVLMVVENVRGAQEWVGKARWNFGSFYLWGDVPALMPQPEAKKGFAGFKDFKDFHDCEAARKWSSKDPRRKQWSAEIARIPPTLAQWVARVLKPNCEHNSK